MIIEKQVPTRPGQFVLRTADPDTVGPFYRALFGWDTDAGGAFRSGGRLVARVERGAGGWLPYLTVLDLDLALVDASGAGATVQGPPVDGPAGRGAVVRTPGGAALGLWQADSGPGVEVMAEPGAVVWVEDKTHDQAADTAFLRGLFGFEFVGPEGPGAVRVFQGEGTLFGGVMQFDGRWAPDEPPHWLLYVQTADAGSTAAAARAAGGSVWFPPFDTPLGRMAYLRDPDGNAFAVVTLSEQGRSMTGGDIA